MKRTNIEKMRKIAEELDRKMKNIKVTEVFFPMSNEWHLIKGERLYLIPADNGHYFLCSCGFKAYQEFDILKHLHEDHGLPQSHAILLFNIRDEDWSQAYIPFEKAHKMLPKNAKIIPLE